MRLRGREAHQADWDALGRLDPLYAIASGADKRFGGWDVDEFYASGANEVRLLVEVCDRLGVSPRGRVLEVGCGAGRLARHVAPRFDRYVGVDVAPAMLALARRLDDELPNCEWRQSTGSDLAMFAAADFDVVFSNLVLQHCPSRAVIRSLIGEMVRVVRPGGVAVFQLPASMPVRMRLQLRRRVYRVLRAAGVSDAVLYNRLGLHPIRMNWLSRADVERTVAAAGGSVREVHDGWLGVPGSVGGELNLSYVVSV